MSKLKTVLETLAKKAGVDKNDDFLMLIGASELDKFEMPDALATSLTGLFSREEAITEAQSDPKLKDHFIGQFAAGFRERTVKELKALGFTEEEITELNSQKNVSDVIFPALKKLHEKAGKGGKTGEEATRLIAELQLKLQEKEGEIEKRVGETKAQYLKRLQDLALGKYVGKFKWADSFAEEIRETVYNTSIQKLLAEKQAKLVFNEETLDWKIVRAADESLAYVENGKELAFDDIHALALQKYKLVAPADPGGAGDKGGDKGAFQKPPGGNPGGGGTAELDARRVSLLDKLGGPPAQ